MKKLLSILLIIQILFINLVPIVKAEGEAVAEPTVVEVTSSSTSESSPTGTQTEASSTVNVSPSPSPTLTEEEQDALEEEAERQALLERRARTAAAREAALEEYYREEGDPNRTVSATSAYAIGTGTSTGGTVGTGSSITTGDANVSGAVVTTANDNLVGSAGVVGGADGAQITTSGNGPSSTNTGAIVLDSDSATIQDNDADVNTSLNLEGTSGENTNSRNVGGDSSITTGDANVSGTVITAVNTNVAGVIISEFNVTDNHVGDIMLDFGAACISGCGSTSSSVTNSGNGEESTNTGTIDQTNNNTTTQTNDAVIGSELVLVANSGDNVSSENVGGDSNITTGDANVSGNVLTFANNNVAGNVIYAVVNIFGDLIGDIIMTEDAINTCCAGTDLSATNTGNGSGSSNTAEIDVENNNTFTQANDAVIDNNLVLDAQTGDNTSNSNVGGDTGITTGDVDVTASLLNVVNTNLVGGNMWLVLINEAGNWVGKLFGAPEGSTFAASAGADYSIDENGYITVTNSQNGPDSTNTGSVTETNNNSITQTNTAEVNNSLNLSANTGGNNASRNTGGNSTITTGDATIIANLVNFVNNNIVGDGKLVVTIVNVFGSWLGDFVTPGHTKTAASSSSNGTTATGGTGSNTDNNSSSNVNTSNSANLQTTGGGIVQAAQQLVPGLFNNAQQPTTNSTSVTENTSRGSQVAGISTSSSKKSAVLSKKIRVNLAWMILILPMATVAIVLRKMLLKRLTVRTTV
jgi:hypothetical protein